MCVSILLPSEAFAEAELVAANAVVVIAVFVILVAGGGVPKPLSPWSRRMRSKLSLIF